MVISKVFQTLFLPSKILPLVQVSEHLRVNLARQKLVSEDPKSPQKRPLQGFCFATQVFEYF